jgi:hypothetical protein
MKNDWVTNSALEVTETWLNALSTELFPQLAIFTQQFFTFIRDDSLMASN